MKGLEDALRDNGGVVGLGFGRQRIAREVVAGDLVRILPGVYAPPGSDRRLAALRFRDPGAVVVGRAAAALSWWPDLRVSTVQAVRTSASLPPASGFEWVRRKIPASRIVVAGGMRITDPALTVLDLLDELGGQAIDEALRRRAVRLADLHSALDEVAGRRGHKARRQLVRDSRDEPWSEAERTFHRLLRAIDLPWPFTTNHAVRHPGGLCFLDVAIGELRLAFEIDGRGFHSSAGEFAADRKRDVELTLLGWRVHRFAATSLWDAPDWVAGSVLALCRLRAKELGLHPRGRRTWSGQLGLDEPA